MRQIVVYFTILLTSCFLGREQVPLEERALVQALPPTKQKQKIALLQKKLSRAEKQMKQTQDEMDRLGAVLQQAQLSMICRQVEDYEKQISKMQLDPQKYLELTKTEPPTLFLKERELLHQMIQTGPSPNAFEAQVVLDRILQMITEIGDRSKR